MNAFVIYNSSNGEATRNMYAKLEAGGVVGFIAMNLFRAQKASSRAKEYSRRFKGVAYDKKNWSLGLLCEALKQHGAALGIVFGWKQDPKQEFYPWVLYVDLPTGQVSFHSATRGNGPDYLGEWDGSTNSSAARIIRWVQGILDEQKDENDARDLKHEFES